LRIGWERRKRRKRENRDGIAREKDEREKKKSE
jgi:hypothetical protein